MTKLPTTTIRSISDVVTKGTTPTSLGRAFTSNGVRFIKVETITANGNYLPNKVAYIDADTHNILRRSQLRQDDILFSIAGALGRTTVVDISWLPANTNQAFAIIRPSKRSEINSRYLLWALRSQDISHRISEINVQAAQANLSLEQVRDFEIPVPDIETQNLIAAALEDADGLVTALERLIAKKQSIKQGIMQQLLTGKTRLPGFNESWRSRLLSEMLSYEQPGRFLVKTSKQLDVGRIPVLTAGKTFILGHTNESHGVYTAHPVIIFDDFTTASKYVDFNFKAKSSAMKILSAKTGMNLRFIYERMQLIDFPLNDHKRYWISEYSKQELLVPDEHEQIAISSIIADAAYEIETLRSRLAKAQVIKQGMMQGLLTGRTRISVDTAQP